MITQDGNFITGFVKQCFDAGLSEDETTLLYDAAVWREDLKDPDFNKGFKQASEDGGLNPFSVMSPTAKGVGGAGAGAAIGTGIGGLIALSKGKLGLGKRLLGFGASAGAAGGVTGGIVGSTLGKGGKKPEEWVPDYLVPGMSDVKSHTGGGGNVFDSMSGYADIGGAATAAATTSGNAVQPVLYGRQLTQELSSLEKQMASLEAGMSSGEGLSGALSNRRIQSQLDALENRRSKLMRGIGDTYNGVRQDQARSAKTIAARLAAVEGEIESRSGRAGDIAAWLEATRSGTPGDLPGRLWNKVVGAEQTASNLSYEMQRLQEERKRLLALQSRVGGML